MIPVHSFINGTAHASVGTESWPIVRAAALSIERQIAERGIALMITDDPWRYRRMVERATETFKDAEAVPSVLPLLNRHIDPICRHIAPGTFFALIGTRPDRPAPLLAAATGSLYEALPIRGLLASQHLYADMPWRHAPFRTVEVEGDAHELDAMHRHRSHCGSTWVDVECRGKRLGKLMARLNVFCAWLKFGAWPVFGTTVPGRNFHMRVIGKATLDGTPSDIIYASSSEVVADAQRVLAETQTA